MSLLRFLIIYIKKLHPCSFYSHKKVYITSLFPLLMKLIVRLFTKNYVVDLAKDL
jgi:hypothetical protein